MFLGGATKISYDNIGFCACYNGIKFNQFSALNAHQAAADADVIKPRPALNLGYANADLIILEIIGIHFNSPHNV